MRNQLRVWTALAPILVLAAPAGATRIEFFLESTGTRSITVLPGAQVVLEARVIVEDPGLSGVGVSALATPGLIEALDFEVCPAAAGNAGEGGCGTFANGALLTPAGLSTVVLNQQRDNGRIPGLSGSFFAISTNPSGGQTAGTFVLAHITYTVVGIGSGEVLPYYRRGFDGAVEIGGEFFIPLADGADITSGVSLQVIPEPAGFALMVGGLLALGVARSRRR